MAFRGTESPMDFEWQGHGPADASSPFHKLAMQKPRKRTHEVFESPVKQSVPSLRAPNSQPWFFSNPPPPPPPATSPTQLRTPSFTTPRKPADFDFSSGPESSPAGPLDDDDTPNGKPLPPIPIEFTGTKPASKRNSLFGIYGRFAPSPGRGEIKKPASDAMAKRIHKRRRKAQTFEKQLAIQRQSSDDTSDDDALGPDSLTSRHNIRSQPKVQEVGWMTGLFTFIHSYPDAPSIIAKYLQLFFNAAILAGVLYMVWSFYATIRADVDRAAEDAKAEMLAEMAACTKNYIENNCAPDRRLPALETICSNWELCMNRDVDAVKLARLGAHTFAEIFNSFVEPISLKTMVFTTLMICLGLFINNAIFMIFRRSQEQHYMNADYCNTSGQYMHHGPPMNHFPSTPGLGYNQQPNLGWQSTHGRLEEPQQQHQLEYQQTPSKAYGRTRSQSPEKKRLMIG